MDSSYIVTQFHLYPLSMTFNECLRWVGGGGYFEACLGGGGGWGSGGKEGRTIGKVGY